MATRKIKVEPGEARAVRTMLDERAQLLNMIQGAVQMVLARHGIPAALFSGVDGDELIVEVPDDGQPDRTESPTTGAGVVGAIPVAPNPETPSESTADGKNGHSSPVVDAPDAGKPAVDSTGPASHPQFGGVQAFRHSEGS